jgi:aerobic-type carbon monoxide dehydrogenase small subunit (CoxS/CutS family)
MSMQQDRDTTGDGAVPGREIRVTVNGEVRSVRCADRQLLVEVVRENLGLKGTHVGCLNGDCGACTLELDGQIVKSCLVLAASVDGAEITTVDGLGDPGHLSALQEAFWDEDGFQCGFCLPGHLFAARDLLAREADPTDDQIREAIAGNLCRCTGYQRIVTSIRQAAARSRTSDAASGA